MSQGRGIVAKGQVALTCGAGSDASGIDRPWEYGHFVIGFRANLKEVRHASQA